MEQYQDCRFFSLMRLTHGKQRSRSGHKQSPWSAVSVTGSCGWKILLFTTHSSEECQPILGYKLQEVTQIKMKEGSVLVLGIVHVHIPKYFSKRYFWMCTKDILISWDLQYLKGIWIQILTYTVQTVTVNLYGRNMPITERAKFEDIYRK